MRRALTWLLVLPLVAVGTQVAHGLAYWWAYPITDVRAAILTRSGHGYLAYASLALSFAAAVEVLAMLGLVVERARGGSSRRVPLWVFFWLPAVGFVLQEFAERWLAAGTFPWWSIHEPTFWRGLVLQVPVGLLAYAAARLLAGAARAVADLVSGRARPTVTSLPPTVEVGKPRVALRRSAPLAFGVAGRAPPLLS